MPPPTIPTNAHGLPLPNCDGGTKLIAIAAVEETKPTAHSSGRAGAR